MALSNENYEGSEACHPSRVPMIKVGHASALRNSCCIMGGWMKERKTFSSEAVQYMTRNHPTRIFNDFTNL